MWSFKGLIVVVIVAGILSVPMYYFWGFLTQGSSPSPETLRLNQLEKYGMPDFSLPDLDGHLHSIKDYKGQALVVNLWATWCGPCVKEFPSLEALARHFNKKLTVLAISQDEHREDLVSFIQTFGKVPPNFVVLWDKGKKVADLYGTNELPESYILDRQHKLLRKVAGDEIWDDSMAIGFFDDVLAGGKREPQPE